MIKIQRLLLLFCINVCFSQHIHENIQWNNATEPENENKNSIIGVFNNFYIDDFDQNVVNCDRLVLNILNLLKKHKVNLGTEFKILVNNGPGSFSSLRASLAVAKGLKISKKI